MKSGNATSDVEGVSVAKVASVSVSEGPAAWHLGSSINEAARFCRQRC